MELIDIELPNGYKVKAITKSKNVINEIWSSDYYHRHFTIEKDMKILDLGANLGFYSLYAASKGAVVYGFEPEENNFILYKENIKKNNLETRIMPFNFAVAREKGFLNIFIPDFNIDFASCMVTTSEKIINELTGVNYIKKEVQCLSLKEILDIINEKKIDLIKIDCEGSELEIIESAPRDYFKRIANIVMETHNNYSEKEIFYTVKELGFNIIAFEKLNGLYNTGYIFAENILFSTDKNIDVKPVAIIDLPEFEEIYNKVLISGSKSFSRKRKENELIFTWYINDKVYNNNSSSFVHIFTRVGLYSIKVIVDDGGDTSEEIRFIWIFDTVYLSNICDFELSSNYSENIFDINKEQSFLLKKELYPRHWLPETLGLRIKFINGSVPKCVLKISHMVFHLNDANSSVCIDNFCRSIDTKISISVSTLKKIQIEWWFDYKLKESEKQILPRDGITELNKPLMPFYCSIKKKHTFILKYNVLPKDWKPKYIVIGIDIKNIRIRGYIKCHENKYRVISGWQEIKINYQEMNEDMFLYLCLNSKKVNLTINWWFE